MAILSDLVRQELSDRVEPETRLPNCQCSTSYSSMYCRCCQKAEHVTAFPILEISFFGGLMAKDTCYFLNVSS